MNKADVLVAPERQALHGEEGAGNWRLVGFSILCLVGFVILFVESQLNQQGHQPAQKLIADKPHQIRLVEPPRVEEPKSKPRKKQMPPDEPLAVARDVAIATGKKALLNKRTPSLHGLIRIPFPKYLAHVERLGGMLAVYEQQTSKLVGTIEDGSFRPGGAFSEYAPRTRDVTNDLPDNVRRKYIRKIRKVVGPGAYRLLVLLPIKEEQRFVGLLVQMLASKGIIFSALDRLVFSYRESGGRIKLSVQAAEKKGKKFSVAGLGVYWD